jgi:hypothetical protein
MPFHSVYVLSSWPFIFSRSFSFLIPSSQSTSSLLVSFLSDDIFLSSSLFFHEQLASSSLHSNSHLRIPSVQSTSFLLVPFLSVNVIHSLFVCPSKTETVLFLPGSAAGVAPGAVCGGSGAAPPAVQARRPGAHRAGGDPAPHHRGGPGAVPRAGHRKGAPGTAGHRTGKTL